MSLDKLKNWKSDPSKGEVFTPIELVREMLDKIPEEVWRNPESVFLDPCMGKGTFLIEIVRRLTYIYGYTEMNAKSRVYGYDTRVKYVNHLQRRGFSNLRHKDFLLDEIEMKFDAIVGNPPYQEVGATGDNKLYLRFISKGLNLLNEEKYLIFVTPKKGLENIISNTKNRNYIPNKKKICYVAFDTPAKHFKGIGSSFCYFLIKNDNNYDNLTPIESLTHNGETTNAKINLYGFKKLPKYFDETTLSILKKTVFNEHEKFEFKTMLRPNKKNYFRIRKKQIDKSVVKLEMTEEFQYKIMDTLKLQGNTSYFLNYPLEHHYSKKVLISKGGSVPCPFYDSEGEYSSSDNLLYYLIDKEQDGINFVNFINSKLLVFLQNCMTKGSDMDFAWSITNIRKIPFEIMDSNKNIYNFYGFNQNEIDLIENYGI
jgi:hypothetical protein